MQQNPKAPKSPCLRCENREVGCHSNCGAYMEYWELNRANKEESLKRCMENDGLRDLEKRRTNRINRAKKYGRKY